MIKRKELKKMYEIQKTYVKKKLSENRQIVNQHVEKQKEINMENVCLFDDMTILNMQQDIIIQEKNVHELKEENKKQLLKQNAQTDNFTLVNNLNYLKNT